MLDLPPPSTGDLHPADVAGFSAEVLPISYDGDEEETEMATPREELLLRVASAEATARHLAEANAELEARCLRYEERCLASERMVIRGAGIVLSVGLGLGTLVLVSVFRLAGIDLSQLTEVLRAIIPG